MNVSSAFHAAEHIQSKTKQLTFSQSNTSLSNILYYVFYVLSENHNKIENKRPINCIFCFFDFFHFVLCVIQVKSRLRNALENYLN